MVLVAGLFVSRSVAAPVHAAADSHATRTDGTLDVRLDHKEAVSAMSIKCNSDAAWNNPERPENRCNKDNDCGSGGVAFPGKDGHKCQTKNCNYCTRGMDRGRCGDLSGRIMLTGVGGVL